MFDNENKQLLKEICFGDDSHDSFQKLGHF